MNYQRQQTGLSLIELLIAIAIGALILLGATSLFISNKRIYKENEDMSRLQENGRFALNMISKDIRMAGYLGCIPDYEKLANRIDDTTSAEPNWPDLKELTNHSFPIEGIDKVTSVSDEWLPSESAEALSGNSITLIPTIESDAITLRYLEPVPSEAVFTAGAVMADPTVAIPVTCTSDCADIFKLNEVIAITDCETGDLFKIDYIRSEISGLQASALLHNTIGLSKAYDDNAQISRYRATRYFVAQASIQHPTRDIDKDTSAVIPTPSLWRYTTVAGTGTFEEVIEGVEKMAILYGVDTDGDKDIDEFMAAGSSYLSSADNNWRNILAVRIMLLIRSVDPNFHIDDDENTYHLLGDVYQPPIQPVRRRVFSSTVQVYNNF